MKRSMQRWMVAAWLVGAASAFAAEFTDEVRQAIQQAVGEAQAAMAGAPIPKAAPIAVLPVPGDTASRYVENLLKNAGSAVGLNVVEGKTDPLWEEILTEIEWSERKADILDPATLAKFGRLQGAKLLLYAFLREASVTRERVFVELEVHASSIETKQHIWGGTFAKRIYLVPELTGLVNLDATLRAALRQVSDQGAESLSASKKIKSVRKVLLVPLAGDADGYVTGLVKDMFRASPAALVDMDVQTLGQARLILRDQPQVADGVLRGAVRDLYRRIQRASDLTGTNYEARVAVQIEIQTLDGIVWSDTLEARAEHFIAAPHTVIEKVWLWLKGHPIYVLYALAVLIALIVLRMLLAATRRPR